MKKSSFTYFFIKQFVFLFAFALIISSCELKDDLFGDDNNNENNNISNSGSLEIGVDGGRVSLDNLEISVPPNAFDNNNNITIDALMSDDGFGENGISSIYQINGLPATTNKPIKIAIKYIGALTGDPLVAIGEIQYAVSLDSSLYSYQTQTAVDSAGFLIYYLPANSDITKSAQVENNSKSDAINILALGGYNQILSSGGNFSIAYPTLFSQNGQLMAQYFETAFNICENMGFNFKDDRKWPMSIIAKGLSKEDANTSGWYSYRLSNPSGKPDVTDQEIRSFFNNGKVTINIKTLSNDLELRATAGHEFLHFVQNMYEFSDPNVEPEQAWLEEATSVWIEEKFSTLPNYVSSSHYTLEMNLFDGWQFSNRGYADNGYGLSPIFKGVTERYGDAAIVKIFEKIESGTLPLNPIDPVEAVLSVITEPIGNFWHGVLGSYVLGNYYNNQVNFRFLDNFGSYSYYTIDQVNNNISVNLPYHDLSGKLFKIIPGDFSNMETVPLTFTVSDTENCGILVCKYKQGTEITSLGEVFPGASGQILLDDVKPVFDNGYELVVMVSNSKFDKNLNYQGITDVGLTVETTVPEVSINSISAEIYLDNVTTEYCWFAWTDIDCPLVRTEQTLGAKFDLDITHNGSFKNAVYSGTCEYSLNTNDLSEDSMSITFNSGTINFHADKIRTGYSPNSSWIINTSADFNEIPLLKSYTDTIAGNIYDMEEYYINGSSVSDINFSHSNESTVDYNRLKSIQSSGDKAFIKVVVQSNWRHM